ncbi:MAG: dihydrofolate reductase family protein [Bacteroidota bacterium]
MKKIVYYVASSIDGFISGPNNDISAFKGEGPAVEKYLSDLQHFQTVIMGRNTYEFGYAYSLKAGQRAYPHMEHYIVSDTLSFDESSREVNCIGLSIDNVERVRQESSTDVYLCGGGQLAGWMLERGLINIIKLKLNPIALGDGVRIFGNSKASAKMELTQRETFDKAFEILTYEVIN